MNGNTSEDTFGKRSHNLFIVLDLSAYKTAQSATILLIDDHVMSHVDKTTGKISSVGGLQCGIRKTLTGTVGRDEVLKHRQTLLKVGKNRVLDDLTTLCACLLRFSHKTTHTGQLTNLVLRTTGTRVKHHEYRVEALVGGCHLLHERVGKT